MKVWGVTKQEKTIVVYEDHKNGKDVVLYDGKTKLESSYELFRQEKQNYYTSGFKFIKCDSDKTLEESWKSFNEDAIILKKETNGLINLFKSGNESQTALDLFFHFLRKNKKFEKTIFHTPALIWDFEKEFISSAMFGALTYAEKYKGPGFKFDIISMYPFIMKRKDLLFPIDMGTEKKMKEIIIREDELSIWKCEIYESEDEKVNKLFRFNDKGSYTNIDIKLAQKLNLKIELDLDEEFNVIIYPVYKCATGEQLFGAYVDYMYSLKIKNIPRAKTILNCVWGKLCEKQKIKISMEREQSEIIKISNDKNLIGITPFGDDKIIFDVSKKNYGFKYDFARIGPFLLAYGRSMISELIHDHSENIKWLHTDGFISDIKLDLKLGNNIGDLRYEGFCKKCKIKNLCKKEGDFVIA